jgi:archaeosine synthase beta-subunit
MSERRNVNSEPEHMHDPTKPLYVGRRRFLGTPDLVISFYTTKCQFQCTYCALPTRSATGEVSARQINAQIDHVFDSLADELGDIRQLSFGNEGSALDRRRFHRESLDHLLRRARAIDGLRVLSIETRPEYINHDYLRYVAGATHAPKLDVTVGFETQDDHIRQTVLRKKISRRVMEERVALLGAMGVRLTSYVLIKPAPRMTEEHGVTEAVATMEYLRELCDRHGTELVIYLTPTYIAEGSYLQRTSAPGDWTPPTITSIFEVVVAGHRMGLPVYTGLWSEELADESTDFRGREGYDPELRKAMVRFNRTRDFGHLEPFLPALAAVGG